MLQEPIGRGGMAEVWGAVHEREGARAAVKIMTGEAVLNPVYLALFRNEVKGIAGLDHPHIVKVFDHGLLTPEAAEASGGNLVAGSPWLAMERLDGGTLSDYAREGTDWPHLRDALLATLDGLAHAHARGVVHRDIKPGNVLLGVNGEIKLTDFGLVHATESGEGVGDSMLLGTPAYMAPEQLQMRTRDFGPWTDLYAVGCMAWALATGAPPFGRELKDALRGHLHEDAPQFTPDIRLPPDFERWARWLLTKPVEHRVSRAAEASDSLAALGGEPRPDWRAGWRRNEGGKDRPLHGVGLGLLGVRSVPLVGRSEEQDALWDALAEADRDGRPRVVLLEGGAGYGKSRLARWLAERSHELGAAEILEARWSQEGGAALRGMLSKDFACEGLARPEVQMRVKTVLKRLGDADDADRAALTDFLAPAQGSDEDSTARRRPLDQQRELVVRHVARRSVARSVVLVLEDIQWGFDGLQVVKELLSRSDLRLPVLVLATVRDDALAEQPATRMEIGQLRDRERVTTIRVGPLSRRAHEQLVEGMLGLEPGLASRVQRRTVGNPGFTLDLVADWVQRGLLELGQGGYRLKPGVEAPLPLSLYETWWRRLDRALLDRPEQDTEALELAAILGVVVDPAEWRSVALAVDLRTPPSLVKHLVHQKLAVARGGDTTQAWSFAQPMLRATLERRAAEKGRALRYHQEAARVLREMGVSRLDERVGLHLLQASLPEDALPHLTRAARTRLLAGAFPRAEEIIQNRRDALELLALDPIDRRWVVQRLLEAELARRTARLPRALGKADQARKLTEATGDADLLPAALHEQAASLLAQGELGEARDTLVEALTLASRAGDREVTAQCQRSLAQAQLAMGEVEEAVNTAREGVATAQVFGEPLGLAESRLVLAKCLMSHRELPEALNRLQQARRAFQHLGARAGLAESLALLGTLAMRQSTFERAEECYRTADAQLDDLGSTTALMVRARRGLALVELGRYDEAHALLTPLRKRADERAVSLVRALATVGLAAAAGARGDAQAFALAWSEARTLVEATAFVDLDLARGLTRLAKTAFDQSWSDQAAAAASLAVAQWEKLGRGDETDARRLRRLIRALERKGAPSPR